MLQWFETASPPTSKAFLLDEPVMSSPHVEPVMSKSSASKCFSFSDILESHAQCHDPATRKVAHGREPTSLLWVLQLNPSRILERIERLVGVTNEWQAHFRILFRQNLFGMCSMDSTIVLLRDLVDGEVADINVGRQSWFEWCSNLAQLIPDDSTEEWMLLDR